MVISKQLKGRNVIKRLVSYFRGQRRVETWRRAGSKFVQMPQRSYRELDRGQDDRDNGWRGGSKDRQGGKSPGPSNVCQR